VVEIEDDFTRLPVEERERLTEDCLHSLAARTPIELAATGAELVAEARAEMGW